MNTNRLSAKLHVSLYRTMVRIRESEQMINRLFMQGLIPGTVHLYIGEEASATGVMANLTDSDKAFFSHRPHGGAIAKGMEPKRLFAEVLGRADGCTRGRGGSMHLVDIDKGIMPTNPIIGAGIVLANGVAFAERHRKTGNIAAAFFGDGCSNIGAFHEGMNFASVNRLPVVFVCENNLYAVSTRISSTCRLENIADRAKAYGMHSIVADGNDVESVYFAARDAVARARADEGPTLIETKTYRHLGHSRTDPGTYRPKEEIAEWKEYDPLINCRRQLLERGILSEAEVDRIGEEIKAEIEDAAAFAKNSPQPEAAWALEYGYCNE